MASATASNVIRSQSLKLHLYLVICVSPIDTECGDDTIFHLVFSQKKIETNHFTKNSSFKVSENLLPTLYNILCVTQNMSTT